MVDVRALAEEGDLRALRTGLADLGMPRIVDELERLAPVPRAVVFRALSKDLALNVFENLDPPLQRELIDDLRDDAVAGLVESLVEELDPDDRAGLLDELPAGIASRLLSGLDPRERSMTQTLLGYPARSVGRRMTPEAVSISSGVSVGEALTRVMDQEPDAETIYAVPVLGPGRHVDGVVSLRRLLVTDPDTIVDEVMSEPIVVAAERSQEAAARMVRDHGLLAIPVVDAEERLLGILTVDDAMRVLEDEESEDIARTGGTEPLRRPYLSASILRIVRSRILWLLILIAAATLTVNVLDYFEETLTEVVALALFVPLLIGTAGNTGAQTATTVVRAMAVGDVRFAELPRVVGRECVIGILLGVALGIAAFIPASLVAGVDIAIVVAVALVAVCTLATSAGALTPMLAKRAGLDPAVVSAPFITTLVDASGLIVYFLVARAVLGV